MSTLKKYLKPLLIGYLVGVLSIVGISIITATSYVLGAYYHIYGTDYYFYNAIYTDNNYTIASTTVNNSQGSNSPSGYVGVLPRVYDKAGSIVEQGTWVYSTGNSNSTSNFIVISDIQTDYSYYNGYVRIWNGTTYNTYSGNIMSLD